MSPSILSDAHRKHEEALKEISVHPFKRGHQARKEPPAWLWADKIPLGLITLLVGDSELGKSNITCDIAARVTTGKVWPDGAPAFGPRNVVIFAAEDPAEEVLLPRIEVSGGDISRVFYHPMEADSFFFDNPKHMAELKRLVSLYDPALIIIDPLDDYLSRSMDTGSNQSVRLGLKELKRLGRRRQVSIVPIMHLNKDDDKAALNRILGSVAFRDLARSALAVTTKYDASSFGAMKASYAGKGTALRYTLEVLEHPYRNEANPDATISRVQWGEEVEVSMEALIERGARGKSMDV